MTDAARLVLDAASADVKLVAERGGDNRGWEVEAILEAAGARPGDPWCAAWVYWIGSFVFRKAWPLPRTASCAALGSFAKQRGMLVTQPGPGDVLLLWSPTLGRFHHTGFVTDALPNGWYASIEGNTNEDGSANGYAVFRKERQIRDGDRFIRWQGFVKAGSSIGQTDRAPGWAST